MLRILTVLICKNSWISHTNSDCCLLWKTWIVWVQRPTLPHGRDRVPCGPQPLPGPIDSFPSPAHSVAEEILGKMKCLEERVTKVNGTLIPCIQELEMQGLYGVPGNGITCSLPSPPMSEHYPPSLVTQDWESLFYGQPLTWTSFL